jgi:hypothetical protein
MWLCHIVVQSESSAFLENIVSEGFEEILQDSQKIILLFFPKEVVNG